MGELLLELGKPGKETSELDRVPASIIIMMDIDEATTAEEIAEALRTSGYPTVSGSRPK